jgi:hypothetical protein
LKGTRGERIFGRKMWTKMEIDDGGETNMQTKQERTEENEK